MSGFSDMGSSSPLQLGCPIHRVFCDGWEVKISPAYFRLPPIRVPHVRIFGHGFFLASTTRVPHPSRLLRWVGSKNLPRLLSTATNPGAPCPDFRTWVLPRLYNSGAPSIASFAMGGKQKSPPPTFDCHQSGCPMSGFSDMGSPSPLQLGCPIHRVFCDGWEAKISPAYFRLPPIRVPHVRIFGHGFFLASTTRVPHPSRLLRWVGSKSLPHLRSSYPSRHAIDRKHDRNSHPA